MSNLNSTYNRAVWFDIPVSDLDRAAAFYGAVLDVKIHRQEADGVVYCILESQGGNNGCLIPNKEEVSSNAGILLYMNVDRRIRDAVRQVENHGGKVIQRIHSIAPHGYRAVVLDSEGNRIALHSTEDA
ncbi:MAG TPA: VOC family protein [Acidobacteriota bacterium]|nr:VOC family protein [Acidobacteriota bacterium]